MTEGKSESSRLSPAGRELIETDIAKLRAQGREHHDTAAYYEWKADILERGLDGGDAPNPPGRRSHAIEDHPLSWHYACPTCHADVGHPCRSAGSPSLIYGPGYSHAARRELVELPVSPQAK